LFFRFFVFPLRFFSPFIQTFGEIPRDTKTPNQKRENRRARAAFGHYQSAGAAAFTFFFFFKTNLPGEVQAAAARRGLH
jgi:hypothetical protein